MMTSTIRLSWPFLSMGVDSAGVSLVVRYILRGCVVGRVQCDGRCRYVLSELKTRLGEDH
jgi:hypothetical protein